VSSGRFLDTNILVYAHREGDYRTAIARKVLFEGGVVSVQVLNEFASVARAKLGFGWPQLQEAIENIVILCPAPRPLSIETHRRALDISKRYGFSIWDSLIAAAAVAAKCSELLTEDLQHGQTIDSLRIVNPFLPTGKP
jgi:predicted nucleic acid-binding protein